MRRMPYLVPRARDGAADNGAVEKEGEIEN
jgi:hypothetical protein